MKGCGIAPDLSGGEDFNNFNWYVYASNLVIDLIRQNEGWIKGHNRG
jgi:hypothetical protein